MYLYFFAVTFFAFTNSITAQVENYSKDSAKGILSIDCDTDLSTELLLDFLNWNSFNKKDTYILEDSLITTYEYRSKERNTRIDICDYKNVVISYSVVVDNLARPLYSSYFNKRAFLKYAHEYLGIDADSFLISIEERPKILQAFYRLLGVGDRNEYGWICEYSTVPDLPKQREAVLYLVDKWRIDLLKILLNGFNLEGSIYAADALLYIDYLSKKRIKEIDQGLKEKTQEEIKSYDRIKEEYKSYLLQEEDSIKINNIKLSNRIVRTCGNCGSYKIYPVSTMILLSDSAISKIPGNYEMLKKNVINIKID